MTPKIPVVERDSVCALPIGGFVVRYDMGTSKDGPRRCANTVDPGALPTVKESTSA